MLLVLLELACALLAQTATMIGRILEDSMKAKLFRNEF